MMFNCNHVWSCLIEIITFILSHIALRRFAAVRSSASLKRILHLLVRSRHIAVPSLSPALVVVWYPRSSLTWRHRARLRCSRVTTPYPSPLPLFFSSSSSSLHLQPPAVKQRHHAPRAERTRASAATLSSQSSSSSRDVWRPHRRVIWPPTHEDMKKTPNSGTDS